MASRWAIPVICVAALVMGCKWGKDYHFFRDDGKVRYYREIATEIEFPDVDQPISPLAAGTLPPRTLQDCEPANYWPLVLEEAVQISLVNSQVMRDLGGRVVGAPQAIRTIFDPAIQESDPRFGVEG